MNTTYDLIVIGAGSGGIAAAVRAAKLKAKVLLIDKSELGGTCVNVGCVPKKIMWYASDLNETFSKASGFGFETKYPYLDFEHLVKQRQAYIERVHQSYQRTFDQNDITFVQGQATLQSKTQVSVNDKVYEAPHVLLATGGSPVVPHIPGAALGITSDGFFALDKLPNQVAIVGAGYIAVEMAGIFQGLGVKTHLCLRHDTVLRAFDDLVSSKALDFLEHQGVTLHQHFNSMMVEKQPNGQLHLIGDNDAQLRDLDGIMWAIGRKPNTDPQALSELGITCDEQGFVQTDSDHNTTLEGVYAVGDITHNKALTPVAIRAGRRLAERLFGQEKLKLNADCIPTVLFSHPPIGTIGLTEAQAKERYGNSIKVYRSSFKPMFESLCPDPILFEIKLITQGEDEKVVGCHLAGLNADEMLQGFAVAIQMGATKKDLDDTIAIHPTSSEELVLMK